MMGANVVDILIAEDNEDDRDLTEFAIKQVNDEIHFHHFASGLDALNYIFAKKKYVENKVQSGLKFVLLDIALPLVSGLDILREIRRREATRELPVIILTSSINEKDMHSAYNLGANSYVMKPSNYEEYVRKIESIAYYWCYVNDLPEA